MISENLESFPKNGSLLGLKEDWKATEIRGEGSLMATEV
jgi:hypothetical protein